MIEQSQVNIYFLRINGKPNENGGKQENLGENRTKQ